MAKKIIVPLLITAAAGLTVASLVRRGKAATKLEFYPEKIDVSKMSLTNLKPDLLVRVVNPRNVTQDIDAVFLNVYMDGNQVGRIQITTPFKIPKLSDILLRLPVQILPTGVSIVTANWIKSKSFPGAQLKGTVSSLGVPIPIDVTLA